MEQIIIVVIIIIADIIDDQTFINTIHEDIYDINGNKAGKWMLNP